MVGQLIFKNKSSRYKMTLLTKKYPQNSGERKYFKFHYEMSLFERIT